MKLNKFTYRDKRTVSSRITASDGTRYYIMIDGSRRRKDHKSWSSKIERRQVLKNRREDRVLAVANGGAK